MIEGRAVAFMLGCLFIAVVGLVGTFLYLEGTIRAGKLVVACATIASILVQRPA